MLLLVDAFDIIELIVDVAVVVLDMVTGFVISRICVPRELVTTVPISTASSGFFPKVTGIGGICE